MNISLTVNLDVEDKVFNDFSDIYKANLEKLIKEYKYDMFVDEYQIKFKYLVQEIKKLNRDILVGNASYNLDNLKLIIALLNENNLEIQKIFIPSLSRRIASLIEGQEMYRNHSRWIDFYPGQVEEIHQERENNYLEIIKYFEDKKTVVVEI
ncbi:hypothetical protein EV144_103231 [Flavobacterium sp. 270]|uniref:hypothetical protein n=1 Tax=Flavobacterium sp. 270 TaxID=2512114 RepID=UPI001064C140|nr:hypothetical protein [Flavobacterium sp. 270]TDW48714.1 hypothetical protein EV144_103231 [Flavobacterium sp. 270]